MDREILVLISKGDLVITEIITSFDVDDNFFTYFDNIRMITFGCTKKTDTNTQLCFVERHGYSRKETHDGARIECVSTVHTFTNM